MLSSLHFEAQAGLSVTGPDLIPSVPMRFSSADACGSKQSGKQVDRLLMPFEKSWGICFSRLQAGFRFLKLDHGNDTAVALPDAGPAWRLGDAAASAGKCGFQASATEGPTSPPKPCICRLCMSGGHATLAVNAHAGATATH